MTRWPKKTNEKNGSFHLNVWKKKFNDDDEYHMATKYYHHSSWIMAYHTLENNTDNDMHTHTSIHHLSDDDHHVFFAIGNELFVVVPSIRKIKNKKKKWIIRCQFIHHIFYGQKHLKSLMMLMYVCGCAMILRYHHQATIEFWISKKWAVTVIR